MLPITTQKKQPSQDAVTTNGITTNNPLQPKANSEEEGPLQVNPLQLKKPANNPFQLQKVVQRVLEKKDGYYLDTKSGIKLTKDMDGLYKVEEGINKGLLVFYDTSGDFFLIEDEEGNTQLIFHDLTKPGTLPKNELNTKAEIAEENDGINVKLDQGVGVVAGRGGKIIYTRGLIGCAAVVFETDGACFLAHIGDRFNEYRDDAKSVIEEINPWINHEASKFKFYAGGLKKVTIMHDIQSGVPADWMQWLRPGGHSVEFVIGDKIKRYVAPSRRKPITYVSTL